MKTNYHTHTTRCVHATGSDEDYVLSAIKGGYQELGFSDTLRGSITPIMWLTCVCSPKNYPDT